MWDGSVHGRSARTAARPCAIGRVVERAAAGLASHVCARSIGSHVGPRRRVGIARVATRAGGFGQVRAATTSIARIARRVASSSTSIPFDSRTTAVQKPAARIILKKRAQRSRTRRATLRATGDARKGQHPNPTHSLSHMHTILDAPPHRTARHTTHDDRKTA